MTLETRERLEYQISVMQAELDGKPIERRLRYVDFSENAWTKKFQLDAYDWRQNDYRVAVTPLTVDWSQLHEDIVAVARNLGGPVFAYKGAVPKPFDREGGWFGDPRYRIDGLIPSLDPGTCNWKDSLVLRPGVGDE